MSYPRNAASPPTIAVGVIYLLADGTIQTTGASARVKTGSGAWGAAAGTLACDATSGVWTYAPTQAETDAESFLVAIYKSASTTAQVTVATSASATAGYSGVDWGKISQATSTVDLSGTTISTTQAVASVTAAVTVGTNNDKTGYSLAVAPPTAAAVADAVWDEATSGHTTSGTYGGQIVRSTNSNVTVQITGSNHIAADVHEFQADVLTSAATDATFVAEVQSGLATDSKLSSTYDLTAWLLTAAVGNISNAQTAAESFELILGGVTYTVTGSGMTESGNRGTTTLSKV